MMCNCVCISNDEVCVSECNSYNDDDDDDCVCVILTIMMYVYFFQ